MTNGNDKICVKKLVECQVELYAFVASLMPDCKQDIGDVVQDTNAKIISHAAEYDASRPFRPWLFTFARNEVKTYRYDRAQSPLFFDDDLALAASESLPVRFPVSDDAPTASLLKHLETCKQRLPQKYVELLDRRYKDRASIAEIAKEKNSNAHTVTTTLAYIRKKLGDCIRRLCALSENEEAIEKDFTTEMMELNDCLEDESAWAQKSAERFLFLLRFPSLLDYWLDQVCVQTLLQWNAQIFSRAWISGQTSRNMMARHPWRVAAIAAGLAILLGGGILSVSRIPSRTGRGKNNGADVAALPGKARIPSTREEKSDAASVMDEARFMQALSAAETTKTIPQKADGSSLTRVEGTKGEADMKIKTMVAGTVLAAGLVTNVVVPATAAFAADASALDIFYIGEPRDWQTAFTNEIPIVWGWGPAAATRAVLACTGMNTSNSAVFLRTGGDTSVFLPAAEEEDLYTLTLAYQDAAQNTLAVLTGKVASVHGAVKSGNAVLPVFDITSASTALPKPAAWPRVKRPGTKTENNVLAFDTLWCSTNAADAATLTIAKQNGSKTVTNTLDGASGWTEWKIEKGGWSYGWFTLALSAGEKELAGSAYRPMQGLVISLK